MSDIKGESFTFRGYSEGDLVKMIEFYKVNCYEEMVTKMGSLQSKFQAQALTIQTYIDKVVELEKKVEEYEIWKFHYDQAVKDALTEEALKGRNKPL